MKVALCIGVTFLCFTLFVASETRKGPTHFQYVGRGQNHLMRAADRERILHDKRFRRVGPDGAIRRKNMREHGEHSASNHRTVSSHKARKSEHLLRRDTDKNFENQVRDFECPLAEDIAPCTCFVVPAGYSYLTCSDVESDEQLAAVFQKNFPSKDFTSLEISSNDAIHNLTNVFNGVTFQEVYLTYTAIQSVAPGTFQDSFNTLRILQIFQGNLNADTFPLQEMGEYPNLEDLNLEFQAFTDLPFLSSPHIDAISFWMSDIIQLELGTFDGMTNASYISVAANLLTTLYPGTFNLRNAHMEIDVGANLLFNIERDAFAMPAERDSLSVTLLLYRNKLTSFKEEVFGELMPYVSGLTIDENPFGCGCDMAWLFLNYMSKVDEWATCGDGELMLNVNLSRFDNC